MQLFTEVDRMSSKHFCVGNKILVRFPKSTPQLSLDCSKSQVGSKSMTPYHLESYDFLDTLSVVVKHDKVVFEGKALTVLP